MQVYNHIIFLNENQRYDLFACVPVRTHGILIQGNLTIKGFDVQSLQETFCEYEIDCEDNDEFFEIDGSVIRIHLPPQSIAPEIPMPFQPDVLDKYDLYDLLNKSEGGKEELFYSTVAYSNSGKQKLFHRVEIKDIKAFEESIEFVDFSMSLES